MSVPVKFLRNCKHPATPVHTPFDDLEVSILGSLFDRYRDLYEVKPLQLASALFIQVVADLEKTHSYRKQKLDICQECATVTVQDVHDLLQHFSSLPRDILPGFDVRYRQLSLWTPKGTRLVDHVVRPAVHECVFCKGVALDVVLKTHKVGWTAPGGHSWSYSMDGVRVAGVCEATCRRCESVYRLQTYTPGPGIVSRIGASYILFTSY